VIVNRSSAGISCALCLLAAPAFAFENLSFVVQGGEDLEDQLRNSSLLVAAQEEGVTDPQEILSAARADYGRLIGSLYNQGHYGGVINILVNGTEADRISPLTRMAAINDVVVRVEAGPSYLFSRAEIAPLAPGTDLPDEFAIGQTARSPIIADAAAAGVSGWRDQGNAKADIADQRVLAQHEANTLDVQIALAPGPRVTFGNLILQGSDAVRPERLREIAGLPVGQVFSPADLEESAARLRRTGVFSSVALTEAETINPDGSMDIIAQLAAREPRRIGFGAELSSIDGLTLTGFWLHRNLLGGAERLRIDGEIAGIGGSTTGGTDYSFGGRFERPATFAPENTLVIEGRVARAKVADYSSNLVSSGIGIERRVNDDLTISYGLGLRFSEIEDDAGTTDYALATLPLSAIYDTREQPLDAKGGLYLNLDVTPFAGLNDSTGSGVRTTFDARSYLSFGEEDRITLAGRVQGGSILGAELDRVPNDYRFYSGGGGTVRGQEYQSLDVMLNGIESGGASFVAVQAELRAGITDSIGLVAFYDYGIVGRDGFPSSGDDSHSGAGLGLRYLTPIGPIRLDVAAPLSGPGDPSGVEVYVGIGQAF